MGNRDGDMATYHIILYYAGGSDLAEAAVANFDRLVRPLLPAGSTVEAVDVLQDPARARRDRIVATPLLVRLSPEPVVKIMGDLSAGERVAGQLGLRRAGSATQ